MFRLLKSLKTRDAALIFCWLQSKTGGVGETRTTSYDAIAAEINADGLKTSRNAPFSGAVVRARLAELEKVDVIGMNHGEDPGTFSIFVYHPAPAVTQEEGTEVEEMKQEPDLYAGRSLFHFENENENENENGKKSPSHNKEYINKKINNHAMEEREVSTTKVQDVPVEPQPVTNPVEDATNRVDFNAPKVAAFRAKIAGMVWDPGINPALIDRLTAAAVLKIGGVDARRALAIAREAVEARDLYRRTDGRAGKRYAWQSLGYSVKRIYETAGYTWTPTPIASEPAPVAFRRVVFDQIEKPKPEPTPAAVNRETTNIDETIEAAAGFSVDALDLDPAVFEREVSKKLHTRPGIETKARALTIRSALRTLKQELTTVYN